jgi:hypothetical protein
MLSAEANSKSAVRYARSFCLRVVPCRNFAKAVREGSVGNGNNKRSATGERTMMAQQRCVLTKVLDRHDEKEKEKLLLTTRPW